MAHPSQEEFEALQLEMMTRYPQQPEPQPSYYALEQQPGYAPAQESMERQQATPVTQVFVEPYYIGAAQRRVETGYPWPAEREFHRQKDKESWARHRGEIARDCILAIVMIIVFVLLLLWAINQGFFGGGSTGEYSGKYSANKAARGAPLVVRSENPPTSGTRTSSWPEEVTTEAPPAVTTMSDTPTETIPATETMPDTSTETMPRTETITGMPTTDLQDSPGVEPDGKLKLVVDVDPGVDDAMALALALTSERASLQAITVVAGNTLLENVYTNTLRVLKVFDKDHVPVYKGADRPISGLWEPEEAYFGPDNFGGASAKYPPAAAKATGKLAHIALRDMIRKRPKELTLVLLGPLTNMAIAMLMEPDLTDDIAHIFILGGNSKGIGNVEVGAEFNFFSDPVAARVVLQRATCPITIVPWETADHDLLPWDVYHELTAKRTTMGKFLLDITNYTANCCMNSTGTGYGLGDFLAALAALYPESVNTTLQERVDVEISGVYTTGQMVHASQKQMLPHIKHKVAIVDSFRMGKVVEVFRQVFDVDNE